MIRRPPRSTLFPFGRLTKTTGPLDTGSLYGSMSRFYLDFGNPATQRVLTYRTIQHGTATVLWNDVYFDGLGRNYLGRSQGPGDQIIQSETTFDSRGLTATQSAPHFSTEAAILTRFEYDARGRRTRSEEHTSELQSRLHLVCRLLLEKKKNNNSLIAVKIHFTNLELTTLHTKRQ